MDANQREDPSVSRLRKATIFEPKRQRKNIVEEEKQEVRTKEIKDTIRAEEKINALAENTNRILYKISSVFPFDFLPNVLIIEETKVNLVFRIFLAAKQIHTVDIKDITNVFLETAPLFATIKIVSRTFKENEIAMGKLRKKEAARAKDIIEALRLIYNQDIDTTKFSPEQLMKFIDQLSKRNSAEQFM